ncbi:MAG TPA: tRNA lysidine(34) synthetase TilS, partial [Phaeodactylibacter sp.]|nr:tRNA lysidine(34) synthetase TilS [Phaeodactylibacter sp.]
MKAAFERYIAEHTLFDKDKDQCVLAVSGGVDSVVLCHLFHLCGYSFGIAHCNYMLRGEASFEDQDFVQQLAKKYGVPFHLKGFVVKKIAEERKMSIQLAARKLRKKWFIYLQNNYGYDRIVTAHHLNDRIETFLYNFTKGTGIRGLRSIEAKNGDTIRPLLFATKADIIVFAKKHNLSFREDASNAETKYMRNKIRHNVVPALKEINPQLEKTALNTFQHLEDTERIFLWAIQQLRDKALRTDGENDIIDLAFVQNSIAPTTLLHELISPYGFTTDQVHNILKKNTQSSGRQFLSTEYRLLQNRDTLIISKIDDNPKDETYTIEEGDREVTLGNYILHCFTTRNFPKTFSNDNRTVWLDESKLKFPLSIRHWQPGDYFYPLGMKGQ